MPSVPLHPRASASPVGASPLHNPLPQLLRTPSGLALLELQGTINVPSQEIPAIEDEFAVASENTHGPNATTSETPVGKLIFPDYSPQTPDDTKWMKRAYLYVGRYQRMTGEVKKLPKPLAIIQKRQKQPGSKAGDELEIVEIVKYKIYFKNRPEPVNDV